VPLSASSQVYERILVATRTYQGKGRLGGRQPKRKPSQAKHLLELHDSGNYTQAELAELFGVGGRLRYAAPSRE
jgi:hypothetical protein